MRQPVSIIPMTCLVQVDSFFIKVFNVVSVSRSATNPVPNWFGKMFKKSLSVRRHSLSHRRYFSRLITRSYSWSTRFCLWRIWRSSSLAERDLCALRSKTAWWTNVLSLRGGMGFFSAQLSLTQSLYLQWQFGLPDYLFLPGDREFLSTGDHHQRSLPRSLPTWWWFDVTHSLVIEEFLSFHEFHFSLLTLLDDVRCDQRSFQSSIGGVRVEAATSNSDERPRTTGSIGLQSEHATTTAESDRYIEDLRSGRGNARRVETEKRLFNHRASARSREIVQTRMCKWNDHLHCEDSSRMSSGWTYQTYSPRPRPAGTPIGITEWQATGENPNPAHSLETFRSTSRRFDSSMFNIDVPTTSDYIQSISARNRSTSDWIFLFFFSSQQCLFQVTGDRFSSEDIGTVHSLLKSSVSTYSFNTQSMPINTANMLHSFLKASSSSSDLSR